MTKETISTFQPIVNIGIRKARNKTLESQRSFSTANPITRN